MTYLKAKLPVFGVVLVALVTMLFSASCGCGSGSSAVGPTGPGDSYTVTDPMDDVNYYPRWRDDNYYPVDRSTSTYESEILYSRWSIASHFIEEIGYHRVERLGSDNIDDWGKLEFLPHNREGIQRLPDDMAYAVYGFKTYNFSDENHYPVYVELDWWYQPSAADVWVGAHTYENGNSHWIWAQPYSDMSVQLNPLWLFQSRDPNRSVYIAVVVTGGAPCTLQEVRLRQYRY
jgi:hypothetical protein